MSSLAPKYGEPAPQRARGSEGAVRAQHLHGRDHRAAGFASHDPSGGPGHRDRGMGYRHLERPAGSSRLVAGLKAQIADTAEPPVPDWPDS